MADVQGRQHELTSLRQQAEETARLVEQSSRLVDQVMKLDKTIEQASAASGRIARGLNWLTAALVIATLAQVAVIVCTRAS